MVKTINRQVCNYSIIRFQPYQETGEFGNIGIVLYAHDSRVLRFKLLSGREHKRITNFFEPLELSIYSEIIKYLNAKLTKPQHTLEFYDELIRPRESIVRYSNNRVLFSENVDETLNELFEHYVKRSFAHHESFEREMQNRLTSLFRENNLESKFIEGDIGNEKYKVKFPFIDKQGNKAVKPIHFCHSESRKIIEHGGTWLMKVKQLNRGGFVKPESVLFTYRAPNESQGILFEAFCDIKEQIEDTGITMAHIEQPQAILNFLV
ncbi:MAG: DUF3037 domain-containing protein [Methylococcales bacterium]